MCIRDRIGIIVTAVNLTINRSPAVVGATMAAVIVFSALSMIFIIQAVSTPSAEKLTTVLPPSAKLVHIHRKKFYKLAKFFAILLAIFGILAIVIPEMCIRDRRQYSECRCSQANAQDSYGIHDHHLGSL